jgi:phosphatidylinositol glycan class S
MSALRAASRARSATLAPCVAPARAQRPRPRRAACRAAADENEGEYGANPDASLRGEHFLAVGRAHCFALDQAGKLQDKFVIEPLPAGAYEAMTCGSKTSYTHVVGVTWAQVAGMDAAELPEEMREADFCEDFEFRAKAALRTWQRQHAMEKLQPELTLGDVRGGEDFNFNLEHKRVLNHTFEPDDADNIKQDMSIDVYGREDDKKDDKKDASVEALYNA